MTEKPNDSNVTSLIRRKMQIKTILVYHVLPIRMPKIPKFYFGVGNVGGSMTVGHAK